LLWTLLAYGALGLVAATRRGRPARVGYGRTPEHNGEFHREALPAKRDLEEQGRGLHAVAPTDIPWSGWKEILWRTYAQINDNRLLSVAAGAVFYSLLALFPAIAVFVALYGLFANPSAIDGQVSALSGVLPNGGLDLLQEELGRLTTQKSANGVGFLVGLLAAFWSASSGVKAIIDALNVAYDEKEKRSVIRLNLVALGYALAGMVALTVMVGAVVVVPIVLGSLGFGSDAGRLIAILRWPALLVLVVVGLGVIYRYLPCRRQPHWQWLSVGSIFAGVAWLVSSLAFSWYVASFGTYSATYGSLGAAVGMMMWMWISMVLVLVGAQLNAEIERQAGGVPAVRSK
jgi:membrane protein